jgi:hypothetical protein
MASGHRYEDSRMSHPPSYLGRTVSAGAYRSLPAAASGLRPLQRYINYAVRLCKHDSPAQHDLRGLFQIVPGRAASWPCPRGRGRKRGGVISRHQCTRPYQNQGQIPPAYRSRDRPLSGPRYIADHGRGVAWRSSIRIRILALAACASPGTLRSSNPNGILTSDVGFKLNEP